ncbi:MAG: hypothetical protein AAFR50_04795 [Pseudomonadota bacterium]
MTPKKADLGFKTAIMIGLDPSELGLCEDWLSHGLEQLVVIEPDPLTAAQLEQALAGEDRARILTDLPGSGAAEHLLRVYNFPGLRSLEAPTEQMHEMLPGLEASRDATVTEIPAAELLPQPNSLPVPFYLRISLLGAELWLLEALQEAGLLKSVVDLEVYCAADALFEGGSFRDPIQVWLQDGGFRLSDVTAEDPDWPVLRFEADPRAQALNDAQTSLAQRQGRIRELNQLADLARRDLERAEGQIDLVKDLLLRKEGQ